MRVLCFCYACDESDSYIPHCYKLPLYSLAVDTPYGGEHNNKQMLRASMLSDRLASPSINSFLCEK